jgi:hypothetical protein
VYEALLNDVDRRRLSFFVGSLCRSKTPLETLRVPQHLSSFSPPSNAPTDTFVDVLFREATLSADDVGVNRDFWEFAKKEKETRTLKGQ